MLDADLSWAWCWCCSTCDGLCTVELQPTWSFRGTGNCCYPVITRFFCAHTQRLQQSAQLKRLMQGEKEAIKSTMPGAGEWGNPAAGRRWPSRARNHQLPTSMRHRGKMSRNELTKIQSRNNQAIGLQTDFGDTNLPGQQYAISTS
nr:uncharacterized protein LOC117851856 isoform X3 [Setaria viridis]